MQEVNALLRKAHSGGGLGDSEDEGAEEEDWAGIEEPTIVDDEAEYINEDKHTTVTIEAVEVDKEGLHKTIDGAGDFQDEGGEETAVTEIQKMEGRRGKRVWTKERPEKPKPKKKKFRYETKADRKGTRLKERSKNKTKAKSRRE